MKYGLSLVAVLLSLAVGVGAEPLRCALVVGNAAYESPATLKNPVNDATDMAAALKRAGWSVTLVTDADRRTFLRALSGFRDALAAQEGAQALFYYAGHGMQVDGTNYLIPVKTSFDTVDDIKADAISTQSVTEAIQAARASVSLLILDACRDNPFAKKMSRSLGGTRGLTVVNGGGGASGSAILFSTSPGDVAQDGTGRNGIFTGALLNYVGSELKIEDLFKKVTADVRKVSGGAQNPWINASLSNDFYFVSESVRAALAAERERATQAAHQAELAEAARQAASAAQAAAEAQMAAAAARPKGKVRIESYETGQVYWGKELLGEVGPESPLMSDTLATGKQEFRFVTSGSREVVKTATLSEKVYVTVTFGTAPVALGVFPGSLSVTADQPGAQASLDDNDPVELPHVFEGLVPGEHQLVIQELRREDSLFASQSQTVTVVAGKQARVRATLESGQSSLRLTGFPAGSVATLSNHWMPLPLVTSGRGFAEFDGKIDAGLVELTVTYRGRTWTKRQWMSIGQELEVTPSSMACLITLERKEVKFTGKETDFEGVDSVFGVSDGPLTEAPFKGYRISEGRLCRDNNNLYVFLRYADGRPEAVRSVSRFVQLTQGNERVNLNLSVWDDGTMHTGYWNDRTSVWSDGGAYTLGKDFLEMRFSLGSLAKSFLNPHGFDFAQPVKAVATTWYDAKKKYESTPTIEILVGP